MGTVVSLLVERADQPDRLLLGVRDPSVNPRHPGVLSTITQRLPPLVAAALAADAPDEQRFGGSGGVRGLLSYVAESVLSRKLGIAAQLETGQIQGSVSYAYEMSEMVDDPLGTDVAEQTSMLTLRVSIERGADLVPFSSVSYLRLDWVLKGNLARAFHTRDALLLVPDANPFMVCIHGLCVKSAVMTLAGAAPVA